MNDPRLAISKLEQLAHEALNASTEVERAALFGAVSALVRDLDPGLPPELSENIERARWSISAILGYDVTNGHNHEQHLAWALGALEALKRGLSTGQ